MAANRYERLQSPGSGLGGQRGRQEFAGGRSGISPARANIEGEITKRTKVNFVASLLVAGAATVAIAAAPTAAAADPATVSVSCSTAGPGTECQTPRNVQINDSLPPDFRPQYPDFSLFGFGGHGHR
jgi:hypothetical protein